MTTFYRDAIGLAVLVQPRQIELGAGGVALVGARA